MSDDDELKDGEERHSDDAPINLDAEDLEEVVAPEDGEVPLEEAVDGVLVDTDDEDELDIDEAFIEPSY